MVTWNRRERKRGTGEKGSDPSWHSTGLSEFKVTVASGYSGVFQLGPTGKKRS